MRGFLKVLLELRLLTNKINLNQEKINSIIWLQTNPRQQKQSMYKLNMTQSLFIVKFLFSHGTNSCGELNFISWKC